MTALTGYDTTEPFTINDSDGDAVLTARRRRSGITVRISAPAYSGDGVAWIGPNDAARLAEWLVQAACDARNDDPGAPDEYDDEDDGDGDPDDDGESHQLSRLAAYENDVWTRRGLLGLVP